MSTMLSSLCVYLRSFFHPPITKVHAIVSVNGKEVDILTYDTNYTNAILHSITMLWVTPEGAAVWFETEVHTIRHCFKKAENQIVITCYKQDMFAPDFKSEVGIPIKYRQKMIDRKHTIIPKRSGTLAWSQTITVQFRIGK